MYIIVVGCGNVGAATARELVASGHEVLVIDRDSEATRDITEELGEMVVGRQSQEVCCHFCSRAYAFETSEIASVIPTS